MAAKQNWVGRRYGAMVIVSEFKKGRYVWATCDCGYTKVVDRFNLAYGKISNCGHKLKRRHGLTKSPEWQSWRKMIQRCDNPEPHQVKAYRGIKVCERWRDFMNFYFDMGPRPPKHTLDRWPNNAGNYEPGNCRWATMKEQNQNRRKRGPLKEAA